MSKTIGRLSVIIFLCSLVAFGWLMQGCIKPPIPFEMGERTTAPYGYTEMIKREAK